MRLFVFLALLILPLSHAIAADKPDFYLKWMKHPIESSGPAKMQLIQRIVPVAKGKYFSIGEITLMEVPKEKGFTVDSLQKDIQTAMGFKSWRTRTVGKAKVFEQIWPEARKFYRLYVLEDKDTIRMSIATFRMAYGRSLYLESEVMQRLFISEKKKSYDFANDLFARLNQTISHWIMPSANAQIPISWDNLLGGAGSVIDTTSIDQLLSGIHSMQGTLADTNTQISGVNANIAVANQHWGDTNVQLGNANTQLAAVNQNWAGTNGQLNTANQNWAQTNQQLKDYQNILSGIKDQAAQTSQMVDQNWKDTNKIASEYLSTMKDMTRPEKLALMAGATAAGAALGATAVNLAVSGVKWGITEIGRLISGYYKEKKHQERLAEFKQARELYYKSKSSIDSLEASVDGFIQIFETANLSKMPMDQVLTQLNRLKLLKESELKVKKEKLDSLTLKRIDGVSNKSCDLQYHSLGEELPQLQSLVDSISAMTKQLKSAEGTAGACQDISMAISKLIEAEMDLELSRREMVNALSSYIEDLRRKQVKVDDLDDELNRGKDDKRIDQSIRKAKSTVGKQAQDQIAAARENFMDECQRLMKAHPEAREGRSNRIRFCKEFYSKVGSSMSKQMLGRTSDEKMKSTDDAYLKTLKETMKAEVERSYPTQTGLQDAIQEKLTMTMATSTQQTFNASQANSKMKELKTSTRIDRKSSVDDQYSSNLSLFAEQIDGAYQMKKEFEKELTGIETTQDLQNKKMTAEVVSLKNTRLDRLQGKKQKIEELCQ